MADAPDPGSGRQTAEKKFIASSAFTQIAAPADA
jgi:hypothetical protein